MTDFMRDSFSVGSPGTKEYGEKHDAIFRCAQTGEFKSKCAHCLKTAEDQDHKEKNDNGD